MIDFYAPPQLWRSSQSFMAQAKDKKLQRTALVTAALLMGYSAFEAYLNFVGQRVMSAAQKGAFNKERQRGALDKLRKLIEVFHGRLSR
jgi:hypothetical protein